MWGRVCETVECWRREGERVDEVDGGGAGGGGVTMHATFGEIFF